LRSPAGLSAAWVDLFLRRNVAASFAGSIDNHFGR
jgi:hypothetical protein